MNTLDFQASPSADSQGHKTGTIWLELTNGCNLNCSHCYSDSFPGSHSRDKLNHEDYIRLIAEAGELEMPSIQFIGGEPLLYKRLPELVEQSERVGFERIEIFSNLIASRSDLYDAVDPTKVSFATSIYSYEPFVHDAIVRGVGSFVKTTTNISRLVNRGVLVRASFIEMDENRGQYAATAQFLGKLGVRSVSHDEVRGFGRGAAGLDPNMSSLCGNCAGNTLCVTYDGKALPCIMSRAWPLGDVFTQSLRELMNLDTTATIRSQIAGIRTESLREPCGPNGQCGPTLGQTPCGPNGICGPTGRMERVGV